MAPPAGMAVLMTSPMLADAAVSIIEAAGGVLHYMDAYPDEATMVARVRVVDPVAIIARQGPVTTAVLAAAPRLRLVARHGVGVDDVDLDAAHARGVLVTRAPGANAQAVAEHTLAVLLAMVKRLPTHTAVLAAGGWRGPAAAGGDVAGLRLGLLGAGAIAQAVVPLARAFGMTVTAYARQGVIAGVPMAPTLDALLTGSDVLSLHVPRTDETEGLIGARALALLPAGAFLINTGRGGIVDEAALLDALDSGHLAGAALDVFVQEPLATADSLRHHPAVLATPHVAGVTPGSLVTMGVMAAECVAAVLRGQNPPADRIV